VFPVGQTNVCVAGAGVFVNAPGVSAPALGGISIFSSMETIASHLIHSPFANIRMHPLFTAPQSITSGGSGDSPSAPGGIGGGDDGGDGGNKRRLSKLVDEVASSTQPWARGEVLMVLPEAVTAALKFGYTSDQVRDQFGRMVQFWHDDPSASFFNLERAFHLMRKRCFDREKAFALLDALINRVLTRREVITVAGDDAEVLKRYFANGGSGHLRFKGRLSEDKLGRDYDGAILYQTALRHLYKKENRDNRYELDALEGLVKVLREFDGDISGKEELIEELVLSCRGHAGIAFKVYETAIRQGIGEEEALSLIIGSCQFIDRIRSWMFSNGEAPISILTGLVPVLEAGQPVAEIMEIRKAVLVADPSYFELRETYDTLGKAYEATKGRLEAHETHAFFLRLIEQYGKQAFTIFGALPAAWEQYPPERVQSLFLDNGQGATRFGWAFVFLARHWLDMQMSFPRKTEYDYAILDTLLQRVLSEQGRRHLFAWLSRIEERAGETDLYDYFRNAFSRTTFVRIFSGYSDVKGGEEFQIPPFLLPVSDGAAGEDGGA